MDMDEKNVTAEWNLGFGKALLLYEEERSELAFRNVMAGLLAGLRSGVLAECPARIIEKAKGKLGFQLLTLTVEDKAFCVMCTDTEGFDGTTVKLMLERLFEKIAGDDAMDGLLIDPASDAPFAVSKKMIGILLSEYYEGMDEE